MVEINAAAQANLLTVLVNSNGSKGTVSIESIHQIFTVLEFA